MKTLYRSSLFIFLLTWAFSALVEAQSATVISDTEAALRVGEQATVEGTVVKVFTSKNGNCAVFRIPKIEATCNDSHREGKR